MGLVFAVTEIAAVNNMWRALVGPVLHDLHRGADVGLRGQLRGVHAADADPSRIWPRATRQYAEGNFDIRMRGLAAATTRSANWPASFNAMADSLQQTERQRREFIANISHELKTPMTTIAGYTDGILDGTIPPENERQYLQIISDESRRLSRLVRRMLDVSQLQAMDPLKMGSHFDICESMRRVLISLEKKITDRNLDVDADIPEEPILVLGDNDLITQVIYNLLENAAKFATPGSTLYLGVTPIDGKARVTVRNQGETISARGAAAAVRAVPQERQVPQRGQGPAWVWGSTSSRPFWSSTRRRSTSPAKTA